MPARKLFTESELAVVAKQTREKSGKKKAEIARELGVNRANISYAEDHPEQSLTALRRKIIEKYSAYKVVGPLFLLKKK